MINRRLLRIKLLQSFYAFTKRGNDSLPNAEKELLHSIEKAFDLYYFILLLAVEIVDFAEERIEMAKHKKMPSSEDMHPNTRFIDLWYFKELRENEFFKKGTTGLSWVNNPELARSLYRSLLASDVYSDYMESESHGLREDKKILLHIFIDIIAPSEELCQVLEDQSIYWNDDSAFVISALVKDIKGSVPGKLKLPDPGFIFKEKDDESFVRELLRKSVLYRDEHKKLIEKYAKNWDIERIALMDILIMELALAEIVGFSNIPVKVSLNEYIEISKTYSSKKSANFINGILDKIITQLRLEGKIKKEGKGLIGE